MGRSKKIDSKKNQNENSNPENESSEKLILDDCKPEGDVFADLFGDGSENVTVHINRMEPEFFDGVNIAGHLGLLSPGDNIENIRLKFGGGRYKIQKLVNNRYKRTGYIRISGVPRMPVPEDNPERPIDDAPPPAVVPDGASYHGIPLSGSSAEFIAMIERIKLIDVAFPAKQDINDTLLKLVLSRGRDGNDLDNLLNQTEKLGRLVEQFGGGQQSGSNLIDLGMKAIDGLNRYVESASSIQKNKMLRQIREPLPAGQTADLIPEKTIAKEVGKMPSTEQLGSKEIAEKAAGYIVTGYIQDPPQSASDTVTVLRSVLPEFDDQGMAEIVENRQILYLLSRNALASIVEIDAENGKSFDQYFNEVFELFVGNAGVNRESQKKESINGQ